MDFLNNQYIEILIAETLCKGKEVNSFVSQLNTMYDTT